MGHANGAEEVDSEAGEEIRCGRVHGGEPGSGDPGVVDEDVETARLGCDGLRRGVDRGIAGDVEWKEADVAAIDREFGGRRLTEVGVARHRKTIEHPALGRITLDCETLLVPDTDQAVVVYSAEPGTPEADSLALLRVLGTQDMQPRRPADHSG